MFFQSSLICLEGLAYNLGRVSIGSCDFGLGNWTAGAELTFSVANYIHTASVCVTVKTNSNEENTLGSHHFASESLLA